MFPVIDRPQDAEAVHDIQYIYVWTALFYPIQGHVFCVQFCCQDRKLGTVIVYLDLTAECLCYVESTSDSFVCFCADRENLQVPCVFLAQVLVCEIGHRTQILPINQCEALLCVDAKRNQGELVMRIHFYVDRNWRNKGLSNAD